MKITIEHELFSATTESLVVAERLIETIHLIEKKPKTAIETFKDLPIYQDISECPKPPKDIFDTKNTNDVPPELLKMQFTTTKFNPDWVEYKIDFRKQKIVRYSNPCSTLHGHNGGKVWQTELILDTDGEISTCDCEYRDLEKLNRELVLLIAEKESPQDTDKSKPKTKPVCSLNRLQEIADLFNRGCDNKQVSEILGLSNLTVSKYKSDCRKAGLLK